MLSNEEAKQEAIKKAYGEHYERFNALQVIDKNGYVNYGESITDIAVHPFELGFNPETEIQWNGTRWRPISLIGLHDNNGWIRIEPDGSNLPEDGIYNAIDSNTHFFGNLKNTNGIWTDFGGFEYNITHYKPITPEKPPVY